jgi:hypothetical protein
MARVSCGAATFNLRLALAATGLPARYRFGRDPVLVHLSPAPARPPTPMERRQHWQIRRRHTNRGPFADRALEAGVPELLAEAARREGGWLHFVEGRDALTSLAGWIHEADAQLRASPAYLAELQAWSTEADTSVEGVGPYAAGAAPHPAELLTRRDFGGARHDSTRDVVRQPVAAVLGVLGNGRNDDVSAGMALQSVLLTAADLGLATAMYSQPVEVPATRERLRRAISGIHEPYLVLRFGFAPTTCYTNRRPVSDVIVQ